MIASNATELLQAVQHLINGEQVDGMTRVFWSELCNGLGIVAALPSARGIEILARMPKGGPVRHRVLAAEDLHNQLIEFVIDADLHSHHYQLDELD